MNPTRAAFLRTFCTLLLLALCAGVASAQMYKWVDKDGKVRYGDTPPPGVKRTPIKAPPATSAAPAAKDGKEEKKGPLTPAEREKEFRERQEEARKAADKNEKERQAKAQRGEDCARAGEYLRTLQSGQRVSRMDTKGERYYLTDEQIAQETAKAQAAVQQSCN